MHETWENNGKIGKFGKFGQISQYDRISFALKKTGIKHTKV